MKLLTAYCLMLTAFLLPVWAQDLPQPQWEQYGRLINDTPGNTSQQKPKVISDGIDGFILVWEDGRAGALDIYAQRIDREGNITWEADGIPVCRAPGNQNFPQISSDGNGGAIIIWQDYRGGNSDLYAQRIDYYGRVIWAQDGVPVCRAPAGQFAPKIIPDGGGGIIAVWHDYRGSLGEDIYTQRIDSSGKPLWQENGIPICALEGTQWFPEIAGDGSGGAVMVWTDGRGGSSNTDIYAQRVDGQGKILWGENGLAVCSFTGNQDHPQLVKSEEGKFIFVWSDFRGGSPNIHAQKLDGEGKLLWGGDPPAGRAGSRPVVPSAAMQTQPTLASDGSGGAVMVWADQREDEGDIYSQRIKSDGSFSWDGGGVAVCRAAGLQEKPLIFKLPEEKWLVVWEDKRSGSLDLFIQKVDGGGGLGWGEGGRSIAATRETQSELSAALGPNAELLAAWEDSRFGNHDIFSQKVNGKMENLFQANGKLINNSIGSVIQQNIKAIETVLGEVIVVWEDARSGSFNIYVQKIDRAGNPAWGAEGIALAKISGSQSDPQIVSDNKGGAIVVWQDRRNPAYSRIFAQRLNPLGTLLWGAGGIPVSSALSSQSNPRILADGSGGAIITWLDERDPLNMQDLYGQRIAGDAKFLWKKHGIPICAAGLNQSGQSLAPDGEGGFYAVWSDYRSGDRNPDIYVQRLSGQGKILWQEDGIPVCLAPDYQRDPSVVKDEEGDALITWTDKGGGSYDIYVQKVSKSGQIMWMVDGIPMVQTPRTQQEAQLAPSGVAVWEDYRFGSWDIFAQKVNLLGQMEYGQDGIPLAVAPQTQYAPRISEDRRRNVLLVWEDYRSGDHYDVYLQKLSPQGKIIWPENGVLVNTIEGGRSPRLLLSKKEGDFYVFWEDFARGGRAIVGQKLQD